jgi:hypothetical protein
MKSDVFHAYDPTSMRESVLGVRMSRSPITTINPRPIQQPTIGYKSPLSSDLVRFSTRLEHRNDDILRKTTPCRICPQYGHALIFPRKCYYEAQCPLPLLFCANQHGEKAVNPFNESDGNLRSWIRSSPYRLSSTLSKRLAKNDPDKQMTNFGWMKKPEDCQHEKISIITGKCMACGFRPEVPYHLRHERGSQ